MHTVQRLKNKLHKKKHGMLDDFLPIMVFILLLTVLLFTFVEFNGAVNKKTEVNQVARRYILKMEQTGYATSSIQNAIVQELNDLGYAGDTTGAPVTTQNITDNTTKAHQGYGSDICLEFVVYTTNTCFLQILSLICFLLSLRKANMFRLRSSITVHQKNKREGLL